MQRAAVAQSGQSSGFLIRRSQVQILLAARSIDARIVSERCLRGRREPVANRSRTRVRPRFESWSLRQGEYADGEATGFENRHTGVSPGVRLLCSPPSSQEPRGPFG